MNRRLEKFIGAISPKWAANRERWRARKEIFRAQYDMAKYRRANTGWITPSTSANAENGPALVLTRDRSRDLVRNNHYARRIVDVWTAHLVGDGITAAWVGQDGQPDELRQTAWNDWAESEECDADGQLDFYGQTQLAARTMVESGEVLIRKRLRRLSDGLTVPLQLQVIEPDHLDHTKTEQLPNGGRIYQGVQFSPIGRRDGYWLWREHPGDNVFAYQRQSVFVPADQIVHLYRKLRPGQIRGITWIAASGNKIKDTADLDDALIMKAKIEACHSGWIESADDSMELGPETSSTDDDGVESVFQEMEPGTVSRLRPGEKISFSEPSGGGAYDSIKRQFEQGIATGGGITYDQLTGDLRGANYSSLVAGKIEFRRDLSQIQWQCIIPMLCENVGKSFNTIGSAAGLWNEEGARATWMPPRNQPIDPKKDSEAEMADMEAGLESWSGTVSKRGHNPQRLAAQHQADDKMLAKFGLKRFIKSAGKPAAAAPAQPEEEDEDAPAEAE